MAEQAPRDIAAGYMAPGNRADWLVRCPAGVHGMERVRCCLRRASASISSASVLCALGLSLAPLALSALGFLRGGRHSARNAGRGRTPRHLRRRIPVAAVDCVIHTLVVLGMSQPAPRPLPSVPPAALPQEAVDGPRRVCDFALDGKHFRPVQWCDGAQILPRRQCTISWGNGSRAIWCGELEEDSRQLLIQCWTHRQRYQGQMEKYAKERPRSLSIIQSEVQC